MTAPLDHAALGGVLDPADLEADVFETDTFEALDAEFARLADMQFRIANTAYFLETVFLPALLAFAGCLGVICVISQTAKLLG